MIQQIKTLIADDHKIVLEGLEYLLSLDQNIKVIGTAQNGEEVLSFTNKNTVDLIIMDINMPVLDGIRCAKELKKNYPKIKIIILTMYAQKTFINELVQVVDGCLVKSNSGSQLTSIIHKVMDGIKHFTDFEEHAQNEGSTLGDREVEIVKLLAEGLTSEQIGDKLFISIHTVKTHRKNILRKTGLSSTPDLIAYAINNQLI